MATSLDQDIRDENRLPWLETVDEDYREDGSILRTAIIALIGLAVIGGIIALLFLMNRPAAPSAGTGRLIAAPEGDYKVKPDTPGGMKVEGEGDTAFATSEGKATGNASIDLQATPEVPIGFEADKTSRNALAQRQIAERLAAQQKADRTSPEQVAAKTAPAPAQPMATAKVPPSAGKLTAPAPVQMPAIAKSPAGTGGALVQLGSFPTEAAANTAWARASKRFAYLAPLGKSVQVATVNGATVYRLRVNAGSAGQASELCSKLKVAGEACFVPSS